MQVKHYEPRNRSLGLLGRLLDEELGPVFSHDAEAIADWSPAVDIDEAADRYVVTADLPGVAPADIDITMENGVLTVQGERTRSQASEAQGYRRFERASGRFIRRFALPDTANGDDITAVTRDGVLELTIPKHPTLQPRKIAVTSA